MSRKNSVDKLFLELLHQSDESRNAILVDMLRNGEIDSEAAKQVRRLLESDKQASQAGWLESPIQVGFDDETEDEDSLKTPMTLGLEASDLSTWSSNERYGSKPSSTGALPACIDRYSVERVLGRGAFGIVYQAFDSRLQRKVAIKIPHQQIDGRLRDTYLSEARTIAQLEHDNIVPVYDVGCNDEFPLFIVTKLISGQDLAHTPHQTGGTGQLPLSLRPSQKPSTTHIPKDFFTETSSQATY